MESIFVNLWSTSFVLEEYMKYICSLLKNLLIDKPKLRQHEIISCEESQLRRRDVLSFAATSLIVILTISSSLALQPVWVATDKSKVQEEEKRMIGALESLFDPNEKTKSGKVLPKAYLKSAKELVKTLRESIKEDPKDNAKFRRTADAAKESIRDYLGNWRGQQVVASEESYVELEKAIRSLASFYSKAGPSASLPKAVKSEILTDLEKLKNSCRAMKHVCKGM